MLVVKNPSANAGGLRDLSLMPGREEEEERRSRRKWQLSPVFLPVESHGQRSLVGYSPWGRKESDTTEQLSSYARTGQITTMASKVQVTLIFCD